MLSPGNGSSPKASNKRSERVRAASRRVKAHIRHAAFTRAPIWLSGGRLSTIRKDCQVVVTERTIALPNLPDALDGLRIAHLSDLHVGELIRPQHLPAIVEACQALNADLIAVTGDFVDLSLRQVLEPTAKALMQLAAPLGVHMVMGNHDYLDSGQRLIDRFREANLGLLVNESLAVEHQGCRISIAGIDYEEKQRPLNDLVRRTMRSAAGQGKVDLKLLLAHHPHAFDEACHQGVDLTLSGHTHGGQVVFAAQNGKREAITLAGFSFRYLRGLYQRGHNYLYVTSGVGSWFPVRFKCPAEIACLTLRSAPDLASEGVSHP